MYVNDFYDKKKDIFCVKKCPYLMALSKHPLFQKIHNEFVIPGLMRERTIRTVFDPPAARQRDKFRGTRTILKTIHRTIAEQTVKILLICVPMTGEIFTFLIVEIFRAVFH